MTDLDSIKVVFAQVRLCQDSSIKLEDLEAYIQAVQILAKL